MPQPTIAIPDFNGTSRTVNTMNPNGSAPAADSSPVTDAGIGIPAATVAGDDTGAHSVIALIKRALTNWTTLLARVPTVGSKTAAASIPVVLASDQAALPLPTGAATAAAQATGNVSLSSVDGKLPTIGQKSMAASVAVTVASDQAAFPVTNTATAAALGAPADTSAGSDTGTFSVLAFIKRALTNWTTLLTRTPALGQALAAAASPAVLPVLQEAALRELVTTSGAVSTFTSETSAQIFAASASRRKWTVTNLGPGMLYVLEGTGTASPSVFTGRGMPAGASATSDRGSAGQAVQAIFGSTGTALVQEHF